MKLTPRAVYNDGTYLDLKEGASYESIDRSRLASFCLVKCLPDMEYYDNLDKEWRQKYEDVLSELGPEYNQIISDASLTRSKAEELVADVNSKTWQAFTERNYYLLKRDVARQQYDELTKLGKKEIVIFHFILQKGQRLIWRKRTIATPGKGENVWHLVGWQKTIKGENIQCIGYISEEDGYVLMAGEWQGEHILTGNVELLDFE